MRLSGKRAVITGGGRGIGRAMALAFANEGADIAVMARSQNELDEVAELVQEIGPKCHPARCDVTDFEQVDRTLLGIGESFGSIDILVNNAGGGDERTTVGDDDPNRWSDVIDLNLKSVYYVTRQALPYLRKSASAIVINVGSGMGHQPRIGNSSYNVAKAGLWMLTRCLSMELWDDNICVNELIPGPVHTELTKDIFPAGEKHPAMTSEFIKQPEDVTSLAVFLAEQGSNGPTGQSFSLARRPI
ncbi:MAG: 3-oxoacyl-[acyl-carrier protein] reductase [Pirellulaceae bacterium]|jgi:3-oxoacyl-[acyl-carrier protein] reductase